MKVVRLGVGIVGAMLIAFALALASGIPASAGGPFVPELARYVDNVQYPNNPQWIVRYTTSNGQVHFNRAGSAERRTSGVGGQERFLTDEAVLGARIVLDDGREYHPSGCYLRAAPMPGVVHDGVVNPWGNEIRGSSYCEAPTPPRRVSGSGGTTGFSAGEAVLGFRINVPGKGEWQDCYLASAPGNGTVTDGVVNPSPAERAGKRSC